MGSPSAFADLSDKRDTIAGQLRASGSDSYAPARACDGLHGFDRACHRSVAPRCRAAITRIRRQALADSHAPGRPAATSLLAAYDLLKPTNLSIRSAYRSETATYPHIPLARTMPAPARS